MVEVIIADAHGIDLQPLTIASIKHHDHDKGVAILAVDVLYVMNVHYVKW